jgi:hypothetical protein
VSSWKAIRTTFNHCVIEMSVNHQVLMWGNIDHITTSWLLECWEKWRDLRIVMLRWDASSWPFLVGCLILTVGRIETFTESSNSVYIVPVDLRLFIGMIRLLLLLAYKLRQGQTLPSLITFLNELAPLINKSRLVLQFLLRKNIWFLKWCHCQIALSSLSQRSSSKLRKVHASTLIAAFIEIDGKVKSW